MEEIWLVKTLFQESQAFDHTRPSPAAVLCRKHINLQDVTRLGAVNPNWPGERMDPRAVNAEIFRGRHPWVYLATACVYALGLDLIAGTDA
jgi:hypothetical protein